MRTRSVLKGFLTNSDSWDISPQHCLCASAHPAARALPLISGSQHWRAKCSPMGHWQVRCISLQTPTSHKVGVVAQWLLWSLLRGNIFWKAYEPFPCTEETTGRGVWDGLMGSLEIPKVLSQTCSSAATRTQSWGSGPIPRHSARQPPCLHFLTSVRPKSRVCWLPGNDSE